MKNRKALTVCLCFCVVAGICTIGILMLNILSYKLFTNQIIAELPKAKVSECYYSDGFQDYTDYCKYYYTDKVLNALEKSSHFKKVSDEDAAEIQSYFENFEGWVKYEKYQDSYDFDKSIISPEDYFYIQNKDTYERYAHYPDKYAAYNVYFFDTETLTLYFIHSNI